MAGRGAASIIRPAAALGMAALLAFQVVRTALVAMPEDGRPALAGSLWPAHPRILTEGSMAEIGRAAAKGGQVPPTALDAVRRLAQGAPLATEPYLVHGAIAQMNGRTGAAEQLYLHARARDPRSRAARYFLAERYFRSGRIAEGLVEMAALARLEPTAAAPFVPSLLAYATTPGAVPQLKAFFRTLPEAEDPLLNALADDARNADLVLALATPSGAGAREWQGRLVSRLVEAGDYRKAYALWSRFTGVRVAPGLYNAQFQELPAPPPFNWSFPATSNGVAEPAEGGQLDVLYYGRADAVLASQLLLLPAGAYRLVMELDGGEAEGLEWALRCAGAPKPFARLPLRGKGAAEVRFSVPTANCPAQWLELRGVAGDFPRTAELSLGGLRLVREEGR